MPFIKQTFRPELDRILQDLFDMLICPKDIPLDKIKGDVNYCFFKILVTLVRKYGANYAILSNIESIPHDVEKAFHDFIMQPYEQRKMQENGFVKPLEV